MNATFTQVLQSVLSNVWNVALSTNSVVSLTDTSTLLAATGILVGVQVFQNIIKPVITKWFLVEIFVLPQLLQLTIDKMVGRNNITDSKAVDSLRKALSIVLREELQWNVT